MTTMSNQAHKAPTLLSLADAAEYLSVSKKTVQTMIDSGSLHPIDMSARPGARRRSWRLMKTDLDAFLRDRRVGPRRAEAAPNRAA